MDISLKKQKDSNNNIIENNELNKEIPIISKYQNLSIFTNKMKEPFNEYNQKKFINTENNIFKGNNLRRKRNSKKYNLNNFEDLINKNKNHFINNEGREEKLIESLFETMKLRAKKKQFLKNKTSLSLKKAKPFIKKKINHNYTNSDEMRLIKIGINSYKEKNIAFLEKNIFNLEDNKNTLNKYKFLYEKKEDKKHNNSNEYFPKIKIVKHNFESLKTKIDKLINNLDLIEKNNSKDNSGEQEVKEIIRKPLIKNYKKKQNIFIPINTKNIPQGRISYNHQK
jgi:hypothetical protein